jgi:hypothetical protein
MEQQRQTQKRGVGVGGTRVLNSELARRLTGELEHRSRALTTDSTIQVSEAQYSHCESPQIPVLMQCKPDDQDIKCGYEQE